MLLTARSFFVSFSLGIYVFIIFRDFFRYTVYLNPFCCCCTAVGWEEEHFIFLCMQIHKKMTINWILNIEKKHFVDHIEIVQSCRDYLLYFYRGMIKQFQLDLQYLFMTQIAFRLDFHLDVQQLQWKLWHTSRNQRTVVCDC